MRESKFEANAVKWLKERGGIVVKNRAGPGVPVGFPDRTVFYKSRYCMIEFKASRMASDQPGQQATLKFFAGWNEFTFRAYPENWQEIQEFLLEYFF